MLTGIKSLPLLPIVLFLVPATCFAQLDFSSYLQHQGKATDVVRILSEYVQHPSESGNERSAGEFLRELCRENGLHITQMGDENGNFNFAASIRPLDQNLPNIVFLNHIDVVPPGDTTAWTHPPFCGKITDTEVWGRGAFDNKGAGVMQLAGILAILKQYEHTDVPYNVTFLAVSCEETQCEGGARYVVKHHLDRLNPAVVIGEGPPALRGVLQRFPERDIFGISVAHKRALWIKLESKIHTSGHGSITPVTYSNKEMVRSLHRLLRRRQPAIFTDLNVDILRQLGSLERGVTGFVLKHPRLFRGLIVPKLRKQPEIFALFSNTITLTDLDNHNGVVNVVPGATTALLDCRLLPHASSEKFLARLRRKLKNDSIKLTVIKEMPEMDPSTEHTVFYRLLKATILERYPDSHVSKIFVPNFSDDGIFRSHGIPAYSSIPVKIDRSYLEHLHNVDERIPIAILAEGSAAYATFVTKCMEEAMAGEVQLAGNR
ncbi:acetylornithine deacetylase/succinyl-diaminopimelate desuccinylase-like protein [Lewinella aquimaris]|uniref:Acetylornithine deacetylase/succinyl-diaminopimelate desuccinylase-like protein n=1 Tax=Neolewinella aquimaris TaxID=1835722 RepID=A0A840E7F0_9BACT|nr:M20/M25/M40 family metallo-hydrolase [Neolewinella aquimaris]MBB4081081.1 acetylornithine deacetylase/succinyl-diaminopimelate desuccinylase-like protein [Neolewinella aquimaris]